MSLRYAFVSRILRHLFIYLNYFRRTYFQYYYLFYDFSNLVLYSYIFFNFVFEFAVRLMTH